MVVTPYQRTGKMMREELALENPASDLLLFVESADTFGTPPEESRDSLPCPSSSFTLTQTSRL